MIKERLIIKNLLVLKDINLDLSRYNLFIGEQASGKSLILKHLYFFNELINNSIQFLYSIEEAKKTAINIYQTIINTGNISNSSYVKYSINDFAITINGGSTIEFSEKFSELLDSYFKTQLVHLKGRTGFVPQNLHYINKNIFGLSTAPISNLIPAGRSALYSLYSAIFGMLRVNNDKLNIDTLLLEFAQTYERAKTNFSLSNKTLNSEEHAIFQQLSTRILKGTLTHNDYTGEQIECDGFQTKIEHASSGQKEFTPIYVILSELLNKSDQHSSIYIEEPEAHLYPSAQKHITEILAYVTNLNNHNALYLTTHSPYIITVLNNLILANDVKSKQNILDSKLLISFDEVSAYQIIDGKARDLRDTENRLIVADKLDEVSEKTAMDFDELLEIKYAEQL